MDLKELENGVNPEKHWYYQSKKILLLKYAGQLLNKGIPLTVVDVGSGSGFFAYELEEAYGARIHKIYLVDINYSEEEIAATTGQKIEKTLSIPDNIENSLVVLMDVLEHIEDDFGMLKSIKKNCSGDNNYFFITVPAFKSLWSGHDDYLGHYRRYKIPMLRSVLQRAGFRKSKLFYLYGSLFPAIWAFRSYNNFQKKPATSNMRPFGPMLNRILFSITKAEMKIAKVNKAFGVTCAAQGKI